MMVDVCVLGEGEETAADLLDNWSNYEKVDGIAFLDKNKKYIQTPHRIPMQSRDDYPYPGYDGLIDITKYYRGNLQTWESHIRDERLNKVYDSGLLAVQLGGPIGDLSSFNNKGNLIKKKLSAFLGLEYDNFNWQNQRDRIIEFCNILSMITGSIGKVAKDLLVLSQDEISEIDFNKSGISSSMRHKNNPIIAELLVALSKLNANRLSMIHETLMHKNERDGVSWIVEWNTLYSMLRFTSASLSHFNKCISSLKLNKDNMKKNIDNTYGLVMSDFFYKELLKEYSASKLDKIFPSFIDKALKEKKDLLDIVNSYLGKNLNINKGTFLSEYTKSNNDLIKSIQKKFSHIL